MSAGAERHAEAVVGLGRARLKLDSLFELKDGRVVPPHEGACPPQCMAVERVSPFDLRGGLGELQGSCLCSVSAVDVPADMLEEEGLLGRRIGACQARIDCDCSAEEKLPLGEVLTG